MKGSINLSLLLLCCLLTSCTSVADLKTRPVWIDNAQSSYPVKEYLTAVGQGLTRERASTNAQANLAEIFVVTVNAQTNSLTQATKEQNALAVTMQSSTSLQRNIHTKTEQVISGMLIRNSWLSPEGEYYALAVLEKRTAARNLTETIMALDESSADYIDYSINHAANVIASLNALRAARDEQLARTMANQQLKQVSFSGIASDISNLEIEKLIAKKLASMQVSVAVDSDRHKETLQSALAQLGISIVERSRVQISADIALSEPEFINNWYWLRGSYALSLAENGQVISRKSWPVKISAKQQTQLVSRLQVKINENISDYLAQLLSDSPTL
ncbi:LPP20 family lipoprotein [Psychromonas antarctica]|uniref:LPP20 family lipoprotein n=1 Tax=Psychromonas antarctica TaxID=67573 RepID=UPI001EE7E568|nr:LPP20 family lipoprotein [Psychromonas antarctica]MCG6201324.1 LPP20 family lipoprotein [Psychromonas antarctica]